MANSAEHVSQTRVRRYYTRQEIAPFEEDHTIEFKGHCNLTKDEIPIWTRDGTKDSRKPISITLNSFLNSGNGGTVFIGVTDSGVIHGHNLTQYMKDHLQVSLDALMKSFKPPVEKHRYSLQFVPVVDEHMTKEEIQEVLTHNSSSGVSPEERTRPHSIRSYNYCWCHKDSIARINMGIVPAPYIVEISIKAWDPEDPHTTQAVGKLRTHPIHADESGDVYVRQLASCIKYSAKMVMQLSRQLVSNHYQERLNRLRQHLQELEEP